VSVGRRVVAAPFVALMWLAFGAGCIAYWATPRSRRLAVWGW
jgi:hypothetical protein